MIAPSVLAPLEQALLAHGEPRPPDLPDRIEALLASRRQDCEMSALVEALARHWPPEWPFADWLARVHLEDLSLATACAHGSTAALDELEERFLSQVGSFVASMRLTPDEIDEVRQRIRERVLVGPQARIHGYSGRGSLAGWLRTVAVRTAVDLKRAQREPDDAAPQPESALDPTRQLLKERYREDYNHAFAAALATLDARDRALLRMHFVEGIPLDALVKVFRVHRVTLSRRLAATRQEVLRRACDGLKTKLDTTDSDFDSLTDLLRQEIDLSISRILRTGEP